MFSPKMGYQFTRFIVPPLAASIFMYSMDQKRFEIFTYLDPPRFSMVVDEDANEFLIDYQEKLHNLGSRESHGVTYTTYQLRDIARDWWRSLVHCKPLHSFEIT